MVELGQSRSRMMPRLLIVAGALLALTLGLLVTAGSAPATPGVFSLDRLRLDGGSGPEDYIFTAGGVIFPEGGVDSGAYYKFVVTDNSGGVRNPSFPCTPAAGFSTTDNTYTVQASDPVSTSVWRFTLNQYGSSSCAGAANKTTAKFFYVAKATSYADSALSTVKSSFKPGATAYVSVAGVKPDRVDWSTTWILPSSSTACANTAGGDRPDSSGSGALPKVQYLQYRPGTSGSLWNRESNYELSPCPALGSENEGSWKLRVEIDATNFVVLPVFTVDATAPTATITTSPANPSNSTSPSFSFTASEQGSTFECRLDGGAFSGCASPQSYSGLGDGSHTFSVRATDTVGNTGSATSYTWAIDTTAPPAPSISSGPPNPSTSNSATFTFTDSEPGVGFVCQLDGGGFSGCASPQSYGGLTDGNHTFDVKARDAAGNESAAASQTWTIDASAPTTTITGSPPNPSNDAAPSFTFTSSKPGSTFECQLDAGSLSACTSPKSYSGLSEGSHTFQVRATDAAGNVGSFASYSWTVDTTAPLVTLVSPADGSTTDDPTPTFSGSAGTTAGDSSTVLVKVYSGTSATGTPVQTLTATVSAGSYSVDAASPLSGTYTAVAEQSDNAGNTAISAPNTFSVTAADTTAPVVTLNSPADGSATSDLMPTFSGTAGLVPGDASSVLVKVYVGPTATGAPLEVLFAARHPDGSYSVDATVPLTEGTYTAQAEQADDAGNTGLSAANTFRVDTTPPDATITAAPPDPSSSRGASFDFSSNEAGSTFQCQLDAGGFSACASPKTYSGLADGSHTVEVKAIDEAGNVGTPDSFTWTVDATAPAVTLTSPADGSSTTNPTPSFSGSAGTAAGDSSTVTVNVYSGASATGTPVQTLTATASGGSYSVTASPALAIGTYTARADQTDTAGNLGQSAANTFTIVSGDQTPPVISLATPANGSTTSDPTPTFSGTAGTTPGDLAAVTVKVYSGPTATGTPVQTLATTRDGTGAYSVDATPPLGGGTYTAQAEQSDDASNLGKSSANTFTVSSAYRDAVIADNPGGYWRLGETSGTTAADEKGTNPGTYLNGVLLGQPGALQTDANLSASFDGVNDYVSVPHSSSLNATSGVTVEAWVKRSRSGAWQNIAAKPGNGAAAAQNYALWINTSNQPVGYFGNGTSTVSVTSPTALDTNWHHVVATYNNASAKIYVDGALKTSVSSSVQLTSNTQALTIGRSTDNVRIFGGLLDEVAVYPTALSASRIQAHYGAATSFDATAPAVTLTSPTNGGTTSPTPIFSGAAGTAPGDLGTITVRVYAGTTPSGSPVQVLSATQSGGSWSVPASSALAEGTYTAQAEQSDAAANLGKSTANTFTVTSGDITPPAVTLSQPANGSSAPDTTPTLSGAAGTDPNDLPTITVKIWAGLTPSGVPVQTLTTTASGGSWSVDAATLAEGPYTARAEQEDASGNLGLSDPHTFTVGSSYRDEVLADNPAGYWRLGEASGTSAGDETAANPGAYLNGVALGQPGALTGSTNTAASFDGVDDYVSVPDSSSLDATSGVTVEAWVKRSKTGAWQNIAAKPGNGAAAAQNYALWINTSNQPVGYFGNGSSSVAVYAPSSIDTTWHHVVATYDNATAKIYVDGVLKASVTSSVRLTANTQIFTIGRSTDNVRIFGGVIDDVAVYGSALSAARIAAHYQKAQVLDSVAPVVTLSTPVAGSSTLNTKPHFAGGAAVTASDSTTVTVKIYTGSSATGTPTQTLTTTRFGSGAWSVDASSALALGTYTARAEQVDQAANVGLSAPATFQVVASSPTSGPVLAGAGDIADCQDTGDEATANLLLGLPSAVVQTFGDNAYPNGSASNFANCYQPSWGQVKDRTRPALGDHDYETPNASGYFNYFADQLAPFGASAADPTRGYYSYDLGAWHVVVLNAICGSSIGCDVNGQATWLDADLAAHTNACTLAVLPAPRWSSGSVHGSNATMQVYWDVLYANGVDVVVGGDDHVYERFAPQDPQGFYDPVGGLRQFTVGTGGGSLYTFLDPKANSEVRYRASYGILKLILGSSSYEWQFLPTSGTFADSGTTACH
jgi:hypothetical protein